MPELLPSPEVQPQEAITRHCLSVSSHMRRDLGKGRYKLFLPRPYLELSVARSSGMTHQQIQSLGIEHVNSGVKGHATVAAAVVFDHCTGLSFVANGDPYPQHADIVGWALVEEQARSYAGRMADASTLVEY